MTYGSDAFGAGRRGGLFVSYRRTDKEFVEALVTLLEARGVAVWWDANIEGGADWRDSIVSHLMASQFVVIVFSESCNGSKQLKKELDVADRLNKEVVPVLIEKAEPRGFFLFELGRLNWISIYPDPMSKLIPLADDLVNMMETMALRTRQRYESAHDPEDSPGSFSAPVPVAQLPPPALRRDSPIPKISGVGRSSGPAEPQVVARDFLPFRWVDFILPGLVTVFLLLFHDESYGALGIIGSALVGGVMVLALTGLVVFPIRYYRWRRNPYRVAKMLVVSNLTLAAAAAVAGFLAAPSWKGDDSVTEERIWASIGFFLLGLLFALISFVTFVILSKLRAHRDFQARTETY
jgi:TIR domain